MQNLALNKPLISRGKHPLLVLVDSLPSCLEAPIHIHSTISLLDFQDAEPDILVGSTSAIIKHFSEKGIRCDVALKALCKKKGLNVEEANLIGVDTFGIDVRVSSGVEVQTHRFPFKIRATSETAAEKQIQELLFP